MHRVVRIPLQYPIGEKYLQMFKKLVAFSFKFYAPWKQSLHLKVNRESNTWQGESTVVEPADKLSNQMSKLEQFLNLFRISTMFKDGAQYRTFQDSNSASTHTLYCSPLWEGGGLCCSDSVRRDDHGFSPTSFNPMLLQTHLTPCPYLNCLLAETCHSRDGASTAFEHSPSWRSGR